MKFNQAYGLPRGASIYCFFVDQYVKCWDTGGASRYIRERIFSGRVPIKVQFGLPMLFTALHYSFVVARRDASSHVQFRRIILLRTFWNIKRPDTYVDTRESIRTIIGIWL